VGIVLVLFAWIVRGLEALSAWEENEDVLADREPAADDSDECGRESRLRVGIELVLLDGPASVAGARCAWEENEDVLAEREPV
jgi:hypothetical protein